MWLCCWNKTILLLFYPKAYIKMAQTCNSLASLNSKQFFCLLYLVKIHPASPPSLKRCYSRCVKTLNLLLWQKKCTWIHPACRVAPVFRFTLLCNFRHHFRYIVNIDTGIKRKREKSVELLAFYISIHHDQVPHYLKILQLQKFSTLPRSKVRIEGFSFTIKDSDN